MMKSNFILKKIYIGLADVYNDDLDNDDNDDDFEADEHEDSDDDLAEEEEGDDEGKDALKKCDFTKKNLNHWSFPKALSFF